MKLINTLINSNIYISLAAVFLTITTQLQMGMAPQWHPYLFIIFFATLFEYNLDNFITVLKNRGDSNDDKYKWVKENRKEFYLLILFSIVGLLCVVFFAKKEVLIALIPIAAVTLFYSLPIFKNKQTLVTLREIPFLKIFLIAIVWSSATILLPIIQLGNLFKWTETITMLVERFFFIFAITIPFDIKDIEVDKQAGLKTIPLLLNEGKSMGISYISLFLFFCISFVHYRLLNYWFIIFALGISTLTTYIVLSSKKIRNLPLYHYGILDGTMFLQGLLVWVFYYINVIINKW